MTAPEAQPVGLARRIVDAVRAVTFGQLAPEVIEKVKLGLFDLLSCAFEARTLPWGEQALAIARRSLGASPVIGAGFCAAPAEAAFANAVLAHGLVREDMHPGAVSHFGVVVYPTLLALAGEQSVTGRDFTLAAVCGYEAGAAVGRALIGPEIVRHFRPTGLTGPLAGALAGSRLLGLEVDAMVSALGFAANSAGGLNEWPYSGGDEMFFHPGFAARSAVTATLLAGAGARASESALDGPSGLFAALGRAACAATVAPFSGTAPEILSVYYKPAPACNYAQTATQVAVEMAGAVRIGEIAGITVKVPAAAAEYPGCDYAGPFERILQAKMSIQYCVAAAVRRGVIEEANYRLLSDPEITRLARLTTIESDAGLTAAYPGAQGAEVAVSLRNGGMLRRRLDNLIPASPPEIRARFRKACGPRAEAIEALIDRLEDLENVGVLSSLLSQP
jgi:2-methylcitrate dehydratase PrpD